MEKFSGLEEKQWILGTLQTRNAEIVEEGYSIVKRRAEPKELKV